ncbi:SigE family RNA polymerase sigma factor [Nocardioides antri]|uniref:SigE family RNA polymerase sigma factor n=1 Tax=Nocardioides antri TaxID=2607659 RepID=A0A5B1M6L2_9ACTN|nr:SigE family RNA polymerase sigma factor [Nocardioides antri]KAA1428471.1 SigE family RNA polymerase sigma factor [Nocardioides antri]
MDRDSEAAYASYVEQAWGSLVRAAVFLGALPHEAEDIAQTTLVRCYTGWDKVSSADNRDAYVYRMLLNCLRDTRRTRWWKDRAATGTLEDGGARTAVSDGADAFALADAVHRALSCLTKPNRDVVVLRYFVQLTERQTADVLGVPTGTVKSRLSRSLAQLAANDHILDLSGGASR